jgi:hypothetical protein
MDKNIKNNDKEKQCDDNKLNDEQKEKQIEVKDKSKTNDDDCCGSCN